MRLIRSALWSAHTALSCQFQSACVVRAFSANAFPDYSVSDDWNKLNPSESFEDSEQRNFGDGSFSSMDSFYRKLGKAEKARDRFGIEGLGENYNSLADGMENKLKKAATYFEFDPREVASDDYTFRPDVNFQSGMTYDTKDLDVRKPGVRKPNKRPEFETTTEEVLREADFRQISRQGYGLKGIQEIPFAPYGIQENVKFLAKFLTEAGIIIKRSKTGISAKAQRKVAREIKTARAFGLMPFTTMGTKHFRYGDSMENMDRDFAYEPSYGNKFVEDGGEE